MRLANSKKIVFEVLTAGQQLWLRIQFGLESVTESCSRCKNGGKFEISDPLTVAKLHSSKVVGGVARHSVCRLIG